MPIIEHTMSAEQTRWERLLFGRWKLPPHLARKPPLVTSTPTARAPVPSRGNPLAHSMIGRRSGTAIIPRTAQTRGSVSPRQVVRGTPAPLTAPAPLVLPLFRPPAPPAAPVLQPPPVAPPPAPLASRVERRPRLLLGG